jgi:hypothetical protein
MTARHDESLNWAQHHLERDGNAGHQECRKIAGRLQEDCKKIAGRLQEDCRKTPPAQAGNLMNSCDQPSKKNSVPLHWKLGFFGGRSSV